jgi:histidinol-phosphate aminotransferase
VLSRIDLRGRTAATLNREKLAGVLPRAELDAAAVMPQVEPICEDVRRRGAAAIREYTARFDGVDLVTTRVAHEAIAHALAALDPRVRAALEEAARRVRAVHEAQHPADHVTTLSAGARVTERYVPVGRVGVYVPAGLVPLPSSVIMNVIPAQVAGVDRIAVASPPHPEHGGMPAPAILAACALLGVAEVHAVGGAQAIAMFAYGTPDCPAADVVTGPGNVYVTAAKRLLLGVIGTDGEAGPTEVAIIADHTANPNYVAADLIAQAEHDPLAACLLITSDAALASRTEAALAVQVPAARHADRIRAALEGQSACVLVDDTSAALAVSDAWAPEHLEIQAENAAGLAARVRNAGAVFVGPYAPVSLGDYLAGSNHVLPTGGTARHTGGLSVFSFLRGIHVVDYSAPALAEVAPHIDALGGAEDLAAHVAAVRARVPRGTGVPTVMGAAEPRPAAAQAARAAPAAPEPAEPESAAPEPAAPGGAGPASATADDHGPVAAASAADGTPVPDPPPIRPDLSGGTPYGAPQLDVPVRLNTNENPYPLSRWLASKISDAVAAKIGSLNRYPDRDARALRDDLAAYLGHGLTGRQVWAANGSNEIIQQMLQTFGGPGRTALGFEPSYAMHPLIARATATTWIRGHRNPSFSLDADRAAAAVREHQPDLVFLTSPNNPTGAALPLAVVEAVCETAPGMVVVDEAYAEFARNTAGTALTLLPRYPRLVVTRTMSKAFALAGARVGYLAGRQEVIEALLLVRLPYHLSTLTQAVARAALEYRRDLLSTVDTLRAQRDKLVEWLREQGLVAADSDANFVLFGEFGDSHAIWQGLLEHGVLVRETGPAGWLRVSVGLPGEMKAFREALGAVLDGPAANGGGS